MRLPSFGIRECNRCGATIDFVKDVNGTWVAVDDIVKVIETEGDDVQAAFVTDEGIYLAGKEAPPERSYDPELSTAFRIHKCRNIRRRW